MKRPLAGAVLLTALVLCPFLAKPFHVDDALFLRAARQVRERPAAPYAFAYNWSGTPVPFWLADLNPPLQGYILAAFTTLAGERELPVHALHLVFPLACAALMAALGRRLCRSPGSAALATVASPAFLLGSASVMADLPLLAFWLCAVWLELEAERDPRLLWACGAAAACAAMTKYFGLALVPLLLAHRLLADRAAGRRPSVHLAAFLLPVAAVGAWGAYSLREAGFFHPLASAGYGAGTPRDPLACAAAACAFLGGCLLWPVLALPAAARLRRTKWAPLAALFVGAALLASGRGGVLEVLMAAGGIFVAALAVETALEGPLDADLVLLLLWLGGTALFAAALNWSVNARSLLPAAFPAAVLALRWAESRPEPWVLPVLRWAWVPTLAVSLVLAAADQGMASAQRDFAATRARALLAQGRRVRFVGHWGFQHYMEREGATAFDYRSPSAEAGDVVCASLNNTGTRPLPEPLRRRIVAERVVTVPSPWPLATMDATETTAGFYSSAFGPAPFSAGRGLVHDSFVITEFGPLAPAHQGRPVQP